MFTSISSGQLVQMAGTTPLDLIKRMDEDSSLIPFVELLQELDNVERSLAETLTYVRRAVENAEWAAANGADLNSIGILQGSGVKLDKLVGERETLRKLGALQARRMKAAA